MPVSGRKEDLVRRLEENSVFQAEIADIPSDKGFRKLLDRISNKDLIVDYAMRYGNPSIKSKIKKLHEVCCERLIILPLYPQ